MKSWNIWDILVRVLAEWSEDVKVTIFDFMPNLTKYFTIPPLAKLLMLQIVAAEVQKVDAGAEMF